MKNGAGLFQNPATAQFYDAQNGWDADFDYCLDLAAEAQSVLDLGCGTGELSAALSNGRRVVGVDPALAMLEIAKARPGGDRVRWIEGDARDFRLDQTFDLVLLTGHAFQVFLTDEDQAAVLATIAAHLSPKGQFIFDTRNPFFPRKKNWTKDETFRVLEHPELGDVEYWTDSAYADGIMTYSNTYQLPNEAPITEMEQIRYISQPHLAGLIDGAGLVVDRWLGDWFGAPFEPDAKEIIPVGRLRSSA